MTKYKLKPEAQLESDLFKVAKLFKCRYVKIPDMDASQFNNGSFKNKESKRPFDGILCIKDGQNYCIECKVNSNTLLTHQELNQSKINDINKSFYVIRKRIRTKSVAYQIEFNHELMLETEKIEEIVKYFLRVSEK